MNSEEQTLIDGLFTKLKSAETASAPRDSEAEARIKEHLTQQPTAPYYMAQAIVVQEAAVNQLAQQLKERDEQIQKLQAELQQARSQASSAPAQSSGGFLSSIFGGGGSREPQAQPQQSFSQQRPVSPPSGGGWRDGGPSSPPPYNAPQGANYAAPQQPQQPAPRGGGFMSGALQTAAGVAGGVMLAQGLSSMFGNHSQPQEVVEVIKEEPAQVADSGNNDTGGWNDNQEHVTSNDSYGSEPDQGGWDDGGGFDGGDDDSFV